MKTAGKIVIGAIVMLAGIWLGSMITTSHADGLIPDNQPGSADDPIVTKSYVDESVQKIVQDALSKQSVDETKIKQMVEDALKGQPVDSGNLAVVSLKAGQMLYAGMGTEFIVRNGHTVAFSKDGNGIPDLTAGQDIADGAPVSNNHLLLFPKDGGRGIQPAEGTKGTIYVMVRGKYLLTDDKGTEVKP